MGFLPDPLHPAIVHFPIALAVAALALELAGRATRRAAAADAGAWLIVLAAAGGVAAFLTGGMARDEAVVPGAAVELLDVHEDLGRVAMVALLVLAAVRVALARSHRYRGAAAWCYLAGLALAAALVLRTGHLGGQMVFRHGVGTAPAARLLSQAPPGVQPPMP